MSSPPRREQPAQYLPPQNIEAEERVVGGILLDQNALPDVLAEVRPEDFYRNSHRLIFQAECSLYASGSHVDILTVIDALQKIGRLEAAGGQERIVKLADDISTARGIASHAKLVREAAILRRLIQASDSIRDRAASGDASATDLLRESLQVIEEISSHGSNSHKWEVLTARQLHEMNLTPPAELVHQVLSEGSVGFIGGEPKMRKSWLACDLALAVASGGKFLELFETGQPRPVLFVEEEDHEYRMDKRLWDLWRYRTPESQLPMPENLHLLIRKGLKLDDASQFSRLSNLVANIKPGLLILDSLTRIHNLKTNLDSDIKPVLDAFDRLSREHGCAVLTVHHYAKQNLGSSSRGGQRLRGSGDIHARSEGSIYVMGASGDNQIIETESKDHESQRLLMQFDDNQDTGIRIWASPMEAPGSRSEGTRDFIFQAISALSPSFAQVDGRIPLQKLKERTGRSLPTLRAHLKAMDEQGIVILSASRRGSKNPWVQLPTSTNQAEQPDLPEEEQF